MNRCAAFLGLLLAAGAALAAGAPSPERPCIDSYNSWKDLVQKCVAADVPLARSQRCIDQGDRIPSWSGTIDPRCSVRWEALANVNGSSLIAAWYRWPESDAPKYDVVTLVIYLHRDGRGTVRPLYTNQQWEEMEFLKAAKVHVVGHDRIIDVLLCVNGTGGCGQDLLAWRGDHLTPVLTGYRKQFDRSLPKGFVTYKSPYVYVEKMQIEGGGWRNGKDANCCPTLRMTCDIAFAGRAARLSHCTTAAESY